MYICERCGEVRDEDELRECSERVFNCYGEYMGSKSYQSDCSCGGEFVEAGECEICGEYIVPGERVCNNCIEEYATVENAILFGAQADCLGIIKINGFLEECFTASEIENILRAHLENKDLLKAKKFCIEDNKDGFIEFIKENL